MFRKRRFRKYDKNYSNTDYFSSIIKENILIQMHDTLFLREHPYGSYPIIQAETFDMLATILTSVYQDGYSEKELKKIKQELIKWI